MRAALAAVGSDPDYAGTVVGVLTTGLVLGVVEWYGLRLGTEGLVTAGMAVLLPVMVARWLVARRQRGSDGHRADDR